MFKFPFWLFLLIKENRIKNFDSEVAFLSSIILFKFYLWEHKNMV